MMSWHENTFHDTIPLWGESTITGGFPLQGPVTKSFETVFAVSLNELLNKQSSYG